LFLDGGQAAAPEPGEALCASAGARERGCDEQTQPIFGPISLDHRSIDALRGDLRASGRAPRLVHRPFRRRPPNPSPWICGEGLLASDGRPRHATLRGVANRTNEASVAFAAAREAEDAASRGTISPSRLD
jgi:hypothetical protein